VGGREEAALLGVREALDQDAGERERLLEPPRLERRLVEREQRFEQERVVLEEGADLRAAVVVGAQQPSVGVAHLLEDEGGRFTGGGEVVLALEHGARFGQQRRSGSAFHAVRRLSSRPGHTRCARAA
jgi:hypothetical protein